MQEKCCPKLCPSVKTATHATHDTADVTNSKSGRQCLNHRTKHSGLGAGRGKVGRGGVRCSGFTVAAEWKEVAGEGGCGGYCVAAVIGGGGGKARDGGTKLCRQDKVSINHNRRHF